MEPRPYSYFQNAFLKHSPTDINSAAMNLRTRNDTIASFSKLPIQLSTGTPDNSIVEVVVGTNDPHTNSYQRTYLLPRSLLIRHSIFFYKKCTSPFAPIVGHSISLPKVDPRMFQNFIDFMHSNIYSLNTKIPSFDPIHHNAEAWVLGSDLGASEFKKAALRTLYYVFEPVARNPQSNASLSPLRASDIQYVCENSAPCSALRILCFDAVASHWTQFEVLNIGNHMDVDEDEVKWMDMYNRYADFRGVLAKSLSVSDWMGRGKILKGVEEYVKSGVEGKKGREKGRDLRITLPVRTPSRNASRNSGRMSSDSGGGNMVEQVGEEEYMTDI